MSCAQTDDPARATTTTAAPDNKPDRWSATTIPSAVRSVVVFLDRLVDDVDDHVLADRLGQHAERMLGERPAHQVLVLIGRDQDRRDATLHLAHQRQRLES